MLVLPEDHNKKYHAKHICNAKAERTEPDINANKCIPIILLNFTSLKSSSALINILTIPRSFLFLNFQLHYPSKSIQALSFKMEKRMY